MQYIIGDLNEGRRTRSSHKVDNHLAFLSQIELKIVEEALEDEGWRMNLHHTRRTQSISKKWSLGTSGEIKTMYPSLAPNGYFATS